MHEPDITQYKPDFLSSSVGLKRVKGFDTVYTIENVPLNIRERIPKGYILKKYDTDYRNDQEFAIKRDAFYQSNQRPILHVWLTVRELEWKLGREPTDNEVAQHLKDLEGMEGILKVTEGQSLTQRVQEIRRGVASPEALMHIIADFYEFLDQFFRDTLPDVMPPYSFITGASPASPIRRSVYKIQEKVGIAVDISEYARYRFSAGPESWDRVSVEKTADNIKAAFPDKDRRELVCQQIDKLIQKLKQLYKEHHVMIDYRGDEGIVISKDGNVKIIDPERVNYSARYSSDKFFREYMSFLSRVAISARL